ncbi:MAG: hypothetical protein P4L40_00595 [Terracidiphilus sp.]|nr:hypothetical protein [Terracidiphilus sp.]
MTNPTPSMANQPSLTDNVAGTLAYLTIIPAIALLLLEPYRRNRSVRFHAWQCIFLTLAWGTVELVLAAVAYAVPLMDIVLGAFDSLFTLGILVLWIVLLMKAMNGERYRLPILGFLAEKQANA